jgi:uncharacterized protein (DUF58 family)
MLVAAVLAGAGWWKSMNVVFLLSYLMFCLMFFNGIIAWINVRRMSARLTPPQPLIAGDEAALEVVVSNTGHTAGTVGVELHLAGQTCFGFAPELRGKAAFSHQASFRLKARGRHRVGITLSSAAPIGLVAMRRSVEAGDVLVLPACGWIDPEGLWRWFSGRGSRADQGRKVLRRLTSEVADVRGVRPYRAGDSIRSIHWRSSARHGELMVREYDAATSPELVLVVEPWLPPHATPGQQDDLEAALCLATTLALNWTRIFGTPVTFALAGDPQTVTTIPPSGRGAREALAPLSPVQGSNEFRPLTRSDLGHALKRSACLLVSSRPASPYAMVLSQTCGRLFHALSPADRIGWYQRPGK